MYLYIFTKNIGIATTICVCSSRHAINILLGIGSLPNLQLLLLYLASEQSLNIIESLDLYNKF